MKRSALLFALSFLAVLGFSQAPKVKSAILFIPDGTSIDVLSLSRWYNGNKPLAVDEIISGLVKTWSADSTIADSAPAGTAFATGTKSRSGFIGADRDSQPHISVLELARLKGKSTGVVVTCEFPHATPADFVCHNATRSNSRSDQLVKQFVYNSPDLVFGGGGYYLTNYLNMPYSLKDTLLGRGFSLVTDRDGFDRINREKSWALFPDWNGDNRYLSHDADRIPGKEPSLAEMTAKAISILSRNPEGFFLIVEGSQVDWAAHANEPYGLVTDFLAFDRAVAEGLEFARKDGSTLVVVCPDHGNGGISMGNLQSGYSPVTPFEKIQYDKVNIDKKIIRPLQGISWTGRKLATKILADSTRYFTDKTWSLRDTLAARYALVPDEKALAEIESIVRSNKLSADSKRENLENFLGQHYSERHFIGWTTTGHTAEDVFLGVYAPQGINRLGGVVQNTEVAGYIARELSLGDLTADSDYFYPVSEKSREFSSFPAPKIIGTDLVFEHRSGKPAKRITIPSNTDHYFIGKQRISSKTLLVNIGKRYYVPAEVVRYLKAD